jgi:hypothetical protein
MDSASEPSARPSVTGPLVLGALVGASLLSAMFAGDGSGMRGTLPVGGGALLLVTAALLLVAVWLDHARTEVHTSELQYHEIIGIGGWGW